MEKSTCRKCGVHLLIEENWHKSKAENSDYRCMKCANIMNKMWQSKNRDSVNASVRDYHYKHGVKPMSENKECSAYLGCHVAERVLSKTFKDVEVMPRNHPGYDFICNKGKKIDVKSSCVRTVGGWMFMIKKNMVADYFLCLAFDNRYDLNPLYVWLIPSDKINHLVTAGISESTISKWNDYIIDVGKVVECCDKLKEEC